MGHILKTIGWDPFCAEHENDYSSHARSFTLKLELQSQSDKWRQSPALTRDSQYMPNWNAAE